MGRKKRDELSEEAEKAMLADIKAERSEKERREALIFNVARMVGRVETADMFAKYGGLSRLIWLKQVKESKEYKEVSGIETWERFCNFAGLDRRTIDEDIQNLQVLGEEFLGRVANLGLGYRDLRKLRKLSHDGALALEDGVINIGGTELPFEAEFKEEIQAALEKFAEDSQAEAKAQKRIVAAKEDVIKKQERELRKLSREAQAKGLSPEEDAFLKQMTTHRIGFDGYLLMLDPARMEFSLDELTPRMRAAYLSSLAYMSNQAKAAYDTAADTLGPLSPEEEWTPEKAR